MLPVAGVRRRVTRRQGDVGAKRVLKTVGIIGAGAAGNAAAQMLRRRGFDGAITMFGTEAPVDRPNLSKEYLGGTCAGGLAAVADGGAGRSAAPRA